MPDFSFVILYVVKPQASAAFYAGLFSMPVRESSPGFAMLPLRDGVMLGLWAAHDVKPEVAAQPGGSEIAFTVAGASDARALHEDWVRRGLTIAQAPVQLDFGFTFVALDPDGHRIRVLAPGNS